MGKEFNVEELITLMKSVEAHKIGELLLEQDGYKLKIKGTPVIQQNAVSPSMPTAPVFYQTESSVTEAFSTEVSVPVENVRYIKSPIVGTYYSASSPDADPFVQVGQPLKVGDTAFIVESMKVMNEVPADEGGIVAEILVRDGDPVEYGQPILRLE